MRKISLFIAAALIALPAVASAQMSANASITVQATVLRGISITPNTGTLDMLTMIAGQSTGNTVAPASGLAFTVNGYNNAPMTVSWPASTTVGPVAAGMTFTPNVIGGQTNASGSATAITNGQVHGSTLSGTGEYYLWLGGSITPPASGTAPGTYSGTFDLTVAY